MADPKRWTEDPEARAELRELVDDLRALERRLPLPLSVRHETEERLRRRASVRPLGRVAVALAILAAAAAVLFLVWPRDSEEGSPRVEIAPTPVDESPPEPTPEPAASDPEAAPEPPEPRARAPRPAPRRAAPSPVMAPSDESDPIAFDLPATTIPPTEHAALLRCYAPAMGRHDVRLVAELDANGGVVTNVVGAPRSLATCLRRASSGWTSLLMTSRPTITVDLRLGVDRSNSGQLTLRTEPRAYVFLGGRYTGLRTPFSSQPLPAGEHDLELVAEDGRSFAVHADIPAGGTARLERQLEQ